MRSLHRLVLLAVTATIALLLGACSPGTEQGVTPPAPVPAPPPDTIMLSGIAAKGAALDGAKIEVIDANGNPVDIADTATGTDGKYSVVLPADIALPVIIRATPPGGTPILSIVPDAGDSAAGIVANINPVTNLVSKSVLSGADPADNASLSTALASVDPSSIKASGDAIVKKVLGAGVSYDAFADDPNFVASDGSSAGSAADAVLDTIAKKATESGTTIDDALTQYAEATDPPELLKQPGFQVDLVGEMVKKGTTSSADLETSLNSIGALDPAPTDGSKDVFRTVIDVVPAVVASTRTSIGEVTDNADLVNVAVDATVKLIADTVDTKQTRFGSTDTDVADMLTSASFQSTTKAVIDQTVKPIVKNVASDPNASQVVSALSSVTNSISQQASNVVSSFDYSDPTTDVSNVVAGYVKDKVASDQTVTVDTLNQIQSGSTTVDTVVKSTGDVSTVQKDVVTYAEQTGTDVSASIQTLPTGVWDQATWDKFNWG